MLLSLALLSAHAQDCDAGSMKLALTEASPISLPAAYLELAACDELAAREVADATLARMLGDGKAPEAAAAALKVGANDAVLGWLDRLEPGPRAKAVSHFGNQCNDEPEVHNFFVAQHAALGPAFFADRWHLGLSRCRTPEIRALLASAVSDPDVGKESSDRIAFYSFVEVYARNLGAGALPLLSELASSGDPNEASLAISAMGDASRVGSVEGTDPDTAAKAVALLNKLGPTLPASSIPQARSTLIALGADEVADGFAAYRWPERRVEGTYRYFVTMNELATCKNSKQLGVFHHGFVTDPGTLWPDQLEVRLKDRIQQLWPLEATEKCKGTAEVTVSMSSTPVGIDTDAQPLLSPRRAAFDSVTSGYWKTSTVEHPPTPW